MQRRETWEGRMTDSCGDAAPKGKRLTRGGAPDRGLQHPPVAQHNGLVAAGGEARSRLHCGTWEAGMRPGRTCRA